MTKEEIVHCGECIWFDRYIRRQTNLGTCHNQSPIIIPALEHKTGEFPIMEDTGWCGDGDRGRLSNDH